MLKIFYKIRRQLINEGRVKKYLLYAVGEILLVVIGILIALKVNNLNQNRILAIKEEIVLGELLHDLKQNSEIFESNIGWEERMISNTQNILNQINSEQAWNDTLGQALSYLRHLEEFYYLSATYETLNAGGFDLVSSDDLRRKIIKLYDNSYKTAENRFNSISQATMVNRESLFDKYTSWDQEKRIVVPNMPLNELKGSEFYNMLTLRLQFKNYAIMFNKDCLNETELLIEEIGLML